MSARRRGSIVILVLGAIGAISGVILGLVPVMASGANCGPAFAPNSFTAITFASAYAGVLCDSALQARAWLVWLLIIMGLVALIGGLISALRPESDVYAPPSLTERMAEKESGDSRA